MQLRFLFIIPVISLLFCNVQSGKENVPEASEWKRQDASTISMRGEILSGDLNKFKSVFDKSVKHIIVNSPGGDVYEAIQIGMIIKEAGVSVTVRGKCLSSCANYLFTAGKQRVIDQGIVGFHGNATALMSGQRVEDFINSKMPFWIKWFMSEEDKKTMIHQSEQAVKWEKSFFSNLGIPQKLFDLTQAEDKGKKNGKKYAFLLPTPAAFAKYGITNVKGKQSMKVKEAFEKKFSVQLLHE